MFRVCSLAKSHRLFEGLAPKCSGTILKKVGISTLSSYWRLPKKTKLIGFYSHSSLSFLSLGKLSSLYATNMACCVVFTLISRLSRESLM
jgi:hypothetical protein